MQRSELQPQDAAALADIMGILDRRRTQYNCALIQGVYIRQADGEWRNGVTKVTVLNQSRAELGEVLNYGDVAYIEATVSADGLKDVVDKLVYEGALQVTNDYTVHVPVEGRPSGIGFQWHESLNGFGFRGHMKTDWPTDFYAYKSTRQDTGLPYHKLVALDKPVYPDAHHLVTHKIGVDLEQMNAYLGGVLFFLPNYQARLADVKLGTTSVSVQIETRAAGLSDVVGKLYATDGKQTCHRDIHFTNARERIELGFRPTELQVSLLRAAEGEFLDQVWLPSYDMGNYANLDESDPGFVDVFVQQGEGEQLEFKPEKLGDKDKEEIAETAVAFANTKGGRILVGVSNEAKVLGCFENDVQERIGRILVQRCDPPVVASVRRFVLEEKPIYVISVAESTNKPHSLKDRGFYIRHGGNDVSMSRTELDEIIASKAQRSPYSLGIPV